MQLNSRCTALMISAPPPGGLSLISVAHAAHTANPLLPGKMGESWSIAQSMSCSIAAWIDALAPNTAWICIALTEFQLLFCSFPNVAGAVRTTNESFLSHRGRMEMELIDEWNALSTLLLVHTPRPDDTVDKVQEKPKNSLKAINPKRPKSTRVRTNLEPEYSLFHPSIHSLYLVRGRSLSHIYRQSIVSTWPAHVWTLGRKQSDMQGNNMPTPKGLSHLCWHSETKDFSLFKSAATCKVKQTNKLLEGKLLKVSKHAFQFIVYRSLVHLDVPYRQMINTSLAHLVVFL